MELWGLILSGWVALVAFVLGMLWYERKDWRKSGKDDAKIRPEPPEKMGGYQPKSDPKPLPPILPPIATEDIETEIDIDMPSFLGKPEPVKLKITKRKKRRR